MSLKTKLKRKETVAFVGFIISNTPDIKILGDSKCKIIKVFQAFQTEKNKKCCACYGGGGGHSLCCHSHEFHCC